MGEGCEGRGRVKEEELGRKGTKREGERRGKEMSSPIEISGYATAKRHEILSPKTIVTVAVYRPS